MHNLSLTIVSWFVGYPKLKGAYEYNRDKKYVAISLEQNQDLKTQPLFEITIQIEVMDVENKKYTGSATFTTSPRVVVIIPIGSSKPAIIRVDPEVKVLFSLELGSAGEEILGNTAAKAGDVFNRVWAYRELCKMGSYTALKKVKVCKRRNKSLKHIFVA